MNRSRQPFPARDRSRCDAMDRCDWHQPNDNRRTSLHTALCRRWRRLGQCSQAQHLHCCYRNSQPRHVHPPNRCMARCTPKSDTRREGASSRGASSLINRTGRPALESDYPKRRCIPPNTQPRRWRVARINARVGDPAVRRSDRHKRWPRLSQASPPTS